MQAAQNIFNDASAGQVGKYLCTEKLLGKVPAFSIMGDLVPAPLFPALTSRFPSAFLLASLQDGFIFWKPYISVRGKLDVRVK